MLSWWQTWHVISIFFVVPINILIIFLLITLVKGLLNYFILLYQFLKQSVADYIKGFDSSSHVSFIYMDIVFLFTFFIWA